MLSMNMTFYGNQIDDIVVNFTAKNVLLTFQMEQNGTFLENFEYDLEILHKKLL